MNKITSIFNAEEVKRLIKESPKEIQDYIKCLKECLDHKNSIINKFLEKEKSNERF